MVPEVKRFPIVAAVALVVALFSVTVAAGQAPGPVTRYNTRHTGATAPASQFELVQQVSEYAPGAGTAFHSHGGPVFLTVIEGELTYRQSGKAGRVIKAGETYSELPTDVIDVTNSGTVRARVATALLLPAGATLTTFLPGALPAPVGAKVLGATRSQVTAPAASFDVVQLVFDFAPGAFTAVHKHGGPGQVTVFEGTVTKREGSQQTGYAAGQGFPEVTDAVLSVGNLGTTPASMAVTFLLPAGAPLTTVVGAAPGPPATGNTGSVQGEAWTSPAALLGLALLGIKLLGSAAAVSARRSHR